MIVIRRSYVIHAHGVEYRWVRRDSSDISPKVSADGITLYAVLTPLVSSQLVKSDHEQTLVAQLHRSVQPPPPDLKDAFLEIVPEGNIILDHILVSFIFIEKGLRDRDKSPRRSPDPLPKPS